MASSDTTGRDLTVASHRAAEQLRSWILTSELPPGHRLRQEELAATIGASRVPVREALRILESEGLVTLKPNSGAWVAKLDMQECDAVYRVRERVEPLVLAESMPNLAAVDLHRLETVQAEIEKNSDWEHFLALDRELHLLAYQGCSIDTLNTMVRRFWNTTQHYRRAFMWVARADRMWVVNAEHRLLIDAIRGNDQERAGAILAGHIRATRVELLKHPELFESPSR
jgi:DNA-binding GntR family transcriptional regulator